MWTMLSSFRQVLSFAQRRLVVKVWGASSLPACANQKSGRLQEALIKSDDHSWWFNVFYAMAWPSDARQVYDLPVANPLILVYDLCSSGQRHVILIRASGKSKN